MAQSDFTVKEQLDASAIKGFISGYEHGFTFEELNKSIQNVLFLDNEPLVKRVVEAMVKKGTLAKNGDTYYVVHETAPEYVGEGDEQPAPQRRKGNPLGAILGGRQKRAQRDDSDVREAESFVEYDNEHRGERRTYFYPYMPMDIMVKRVREGAKLPTRATERAACYDLYAWLENDTLTIRPHTTQIVPTGLSMQLPNGTMVALFPRSGISTKRGLRPANCVGVIDPDYRGEYLVALHHVTDFDQTIRFGERIAQIGLIPVIPMEFIEVADLDQTERGAGGFGSTGVG